MDIEAHFKRYLSEHNAKEVLSKIIKDGIDEYKKHPAYRWYDDGNPYDHSGVTTPVYGKTIGDIYKTEVEILQALTGNHTATFESGYGWNYNTVGDELSDRITEQFSTWTHDYIFSLKEDICKELNFNEELTEDNYWELLDNWNIINACIFYEMFPEYEIHCKNDDFEWDTCLFSIY